MRLRGFQYLPEQAANNFWLALPFALLLAIAALMHPSALASGWQANLDSDKGILQVITAHYARHPGMLFSGDRTFRPNFIELYAEAHRVSQELNLPSDRLYVPSSMPALSMRYQSSEGRLEFDKAKIDQLKSDLKKTLRELREFAPQWSPKDLKSMLDRSEFNRDPKMAQKLMQILPWFLNLDGELILRTADSDRAIREKIDSADGQSLTIQYYDTFKNHLLQTISEHSGFWKQAAEIYLKQFFEKSLRDAIALHRDQSGIIVNSTVSIELVPPIVSLIKIFDCSMKTIPYYPLLPDTYLFWIRRNPGVNSQPSGYALVHMATVQGEKVPYVITVNGKTLNEVDTRAALVLVAQHFGVDKLAVPNFDENFGVVNDSKKMNGMAGERPVKAYFSRMWKNLTAREVIRLTPLRYVAYYNQDSLFHAKLTDITAEEKIQFAQTGKRFHSTSTYWEKDPLQLKARDRAIMLAGLNSADSEALQKMLDVPEQTLVAAKKYVGVMDSPSSPVSAADLDLIFTELGIPHQQTVKHLEVSAQLETLTGLGAKPQWAEPLAKKLAADLDQKIEDDLNGKSAFPNLLKHLERRQSLNGFADNSDVRQRFVKTLADKFMSKGKDDPDVHPGYVKVMEVEFLREIRLRLLPRLKLQPSEEANVTVDNLDHYLTESEDPKLRSLGYRLWIATNKLPTNRDFVVKHLAKVDEEGADALFQVLMSISRKEQFQYRLTRNPLGVIHASMLYASPFLSGNYQGQLIVLNLINEFYFKNNGGNWSPPLEKHSLDFIRKAVGAGQYVPQAMPFIRYYLRAKPQEVWPALQPQIVAGNKSVVKYLAAMSKETSWPDWLWESAPGLILDPQIEPSVQAAIASVLKESAKWTPEVWSAIAQRLQTADNSVRHALLLALAPQKIWTSQVWESVLQIMQNETDISVIAAIQYAIRYRILPERHKVALKNLIQRVHTQFNALPPETPHRQREQHYQVYQFLEQTRSYNVGVSLKDFPNPEDRGGQWASCADVLARDTFKINQDKKPFWVNIYRFFSEGG